MTEADASIASLPPASRAARCTIETAKPSPSGTGSRPPHPRRAKGQTVEGPKPRDDSAGTAEADFVAGGGRILDGSFAVASLTGPVSVTLDTNRTIGGLVFDNPTNTFGWSIIGSTTLSLSNSGEPTIAVNNANISVTLAATLAAPQGFTKTGAGTLVVTGPGTFASDTTVAAGTLLARGQTSAESATGIGPVTVVAGASLRGSGRIAPAASSSITFANGGRLFLESTPPRACGW